MLGTHSTDKEQFDRTYVHNAHLQKGFNAQIIQNFVDYVLRTIPTAKVCGIRILDLCCGDGGVTTALLQKLRSAEIIVDKMVGYDISTDLIDVAKEYECINPGLEFKVQDLSLMDEREEYDVVISLFGLHWIEDLNLAADKIYQSLKPHGKVMYFVPLEKTRLFALRQLIMNSESSSWKRSFDSYVFLPFRSDPEDYVRAFEKGFDSENSEMISGVQDVEFSEIRFKEFLASWMQELRHLDESEKSAYLDELVSELPKSSNLSNDVENINGLIRFGERFCWYFAGKKSAVITEDITNTNTSEVECAISI